MRSKLHGSNTLRHARSRAATTVLSVLLAVAMVLQGSPFAYAEEVLAAMEQGEAAATEAVQEPTREGASQSDDAALAVDDSTAGAAEDSAAQADPTAEAAAQDESPAPTKTTYTYEDDALKVTATLDDAAAIPDDAQLKVTPITAESDGYNYDAYMAALNNATEAEISPENVLLHDVAFLVTSETGEVFEVEPASGAVHLSFEFKQDQLAAIGATSDDDVRVAHLPLAEEVLADVATTAEATDISAADVTVETVETPDASLETEGLAYTLNSLSVTATYTDSHNATYNPSTDTTATVNYNTVLGRAVEYGVITQELSIVNDFQSNFATNSYTNTGHAVGADLGGTSDVPFIGTVLNSHIHFKQEVYHTPMIYDFYTSTEYEGTDFYSNGNTDTLTIKPIFQDADSLRSSVNSMINHVTEASTELASKEATMDVSNLDYDQNNYIIDTTPYDDNAVIYINVPVGSKLENVLKNITCGVNIKKKSDQIVVFNFESTSDVTINQIRVTVNGEEIKSETSPSENPDDHNLKVDKEIVRKIIWNAPNATHVGIKEAAGLFLAPKAYVETLNTSTGWVVSNKFQNTTGEWHFAFHDRHYSSGGSISFWARKEITDATTGEVVVPKGLDYSTFKFELYETGPDYKVADGAEPIQTKSASNDPTSRYEVAFDDLSFTDADLDKRLKDTHYYVIKEVIPADAEQVGGVPTKDGIGYWTGELRIQVDVSDREQDGSMTFLISSWKYETAEDVEGDTPYRVNDKVEAVGSVFTFGALPNTYTAEGEVELEATKQLEGGTLGAGDFSFTLAGEQSFSEGEIEKYIDTEGNEYTTAERNDDGTYTVSGGAGTEDYTYAGNTYPASRVTDNGNDTYTITVVKRALADEVTVSNLAEYLFSTKVSKSAVTKNSDGTYTYDGKTYPASAVTDNEDDNYAITATRSKDEIVKNDDFTYEFTFEVSSSDMTISYSPTTITYNGNTYSYSWVDGKMKLEDGTVVEQTYWPKTGFKLTVSGLKESELTKNPDGTYSYEWGGNTQTGTATEGNDGTYTFAGKSYPASAVTENSDGTRSIVITKSTSYTNVTKNSDGTYTYDGVTYKASEVTNKGDGTYQIELLDEDANGLSVADTYGTDTDNTYTVSVVRDDGTSQTVASGLTSVDVDADKKNDDGLDVTAVVQADDVVDNGGSYTYEGKTFFGTDNGDGTITLNLATGVEEVTISADTVGSYTVDVTVPASEVTAPSSGSGTTVTIVKVVYDGEEYELSDLTYADGVYTTDYAVTKANAADGSVTFDKIKYTASDVGTHEYTIKEVIPAGATDKGDGTWTKDDIIYDGHEVKVTVTVADNGDGTLKITKAYDPEAGNVFKNKKTTLSGSAVLQVTKQLTGRAWTGSDSFKFDLAFAEGSATTGATLPATTELEITGTAGSTDNVTASYDAITFDRAGEWTFTITEQVPTGATNGIEYGAGGTGVHTIAIKATEVSGALKIQYKLDGASEWADATGTIAAGTFKNAYSATGEATLEATKTLVGATLTNEQFEFSATAAGGNPTSGLDDSAFKKSAKNDADGKVDFGKLTFTAEGTWKYTVKETSADGSGNTVDKSEYEVSFTTTDKLDGTYEVAKAIKKIKDAEGNAVSEDAQEVEAISFTNTYEATGEVTFEGTKTIDCRELAEGDTFTFTVKEGETTVAEVTNDATGKIAYPTISYVKNATTDQTGTHTYTVAESVSTVGGVTASENSYTVTVEVTDDGDGTLEVEPSENYKSLDFENAYEAKGSITLEGTKSIDTRDIAEGESFEFAVYDSDGNEVATGASDDDGKIAFTAIDYVKNATTDQTGTHTYTVVETTKDGNGITTDTREHAAVVAVTDLGNGKLDAKLDEEQSDIDFVNQYEATGSVTFAGTKTMEGRELTADDVFTFAVTEDGRTVATGTSDATGRIAFSAIEYNMGDCGTHTYVVRETSAGGRGVTPDATEHTVTVTVEDIDHNGKLTVTASDNATALDFVNAYDATASLEIAGLTKVLRNGTLKAKQFSFELRDADGKVLQTATNDASGNIAFGAISYELADLEGAASKKFSYTVREAVPSGAKRNSDGTYTADGITYSGDEVSFSVTVSDNGDGTLRIGGAEGGRYDARHTFVNSQEKKKEKKEKLVKTSDTANPGMVAGLAGAGLAVVAFGLQDRRRRQ